jgi:hypothetical protein
MAAGYYRHQHVRVRLKSLFRAQYLVSDNVLLVSLMSRLEDHILV